MDITTYLLPEIWASYLINNDASSLDSKDKASVDNWIKGHPCLGAALSCGGESSFCKYHAAWPEIDACNCLEYTFPILPMAFEYQITPWKGDTLIATFWDCQRELTQCEDKDADFFAIYKRPSNRRYAIWHWIKDLKTRKEAEDFIKTLKGGK